MTVDTTSIWSRIKVSFTEQNALIQKKPLRWQWKKRAKSIDVWKKFLKVKIPLTVFYQI